ncbi:hypothetical protein AC480_05775 [miscellaneous Crenarchaeota group archaeon SMTZ1-55]|nr:MAG: hypothetical protein AC480_05775 [miscellaneous Crenarchaeota group archaeon SMTZ1-55]
MSWRGEDRGIRGRSQTRVTSSYRKTRICDRTRHHGPVTRTRRQHPSLLLLPIASGWVTRKLCSKQILLHLRWGGLLRYL